MAQIIVNAGAQFDITQITIADLRDLDVITATSTVRELGLNPDNTVALTGTGFTYDMAQNFTGGTITGLEATDHMETVFEFTGISVAATTFRAAVESGDSDTLFAGIFGGDDMMTGGSDGDYFRGFGGHDNLFGGDGADTLLGEAGNDHLYGQSASGGMDMGDSLSGGDGSDYVQGNAGNDTIDGGDGSDRLVGGADNDMIGGGEGNDSANGNLGADTIDGGAGNDLLHGGQGNDSLIGGAGNDILYGDLGADTLTGGAGVDHFTFSGMGSLAATPDHITDFADGTDLIAVGYDVAAVLRGSAADSTAAVTTAQSLFDGHAGNGEVAAVAVGADTYLFYASDGGATADSTIVLQGIGAGAIGSADFL